MLVKEQIFINHIDFYSAVEKSICVDVWIKVKTVIHNEEMPSLFLFNEIGTTLLCCRMHGPSCNRSTENFDWISPVKYGLKSFESHQKTNRAGNIEPISWNGESKLIDRHLCGTLMLIIIIEPNGEKGSRG